MLILRNLLKRVDLPSLISEVDKLDNCKLETTLVDLSKLTDVVKNVVVIKTIYDELLKKVNAIQTSNASNLGKKADYNTNISEIKKKIFDHNHNKYITTTQEFKKLMVDNFAMRLA